MNSYKLKKKLKNSDMKDSIGRKLFDFTKK